MEMVDKFKTFTSDKVFNLETELFFGLIFLIMAVLTPLVTAVLSYYRAI